MEKSKSISYYLSTTKNHLRLLESLGIKTLEDFLQYYPRTYTDQSNLISISEIRTDQPNTVKGTLSQLTELKTRFGKKIIKAKLTDQSGQVDIIWFNQPFIKRLLHNGQSVIMNGKAKFELGKITLLGPDYEPVQTNQIHTARLVPVYHETAGLTSKWIREKINPLLKYCQKQFPEYLPAEIIQKYQLMDYATAIQEVHFPNSTATLEKAKYRLAFDELFLLQLKALQKKWLWQQITETNQKKISIDPVVEQLISSLPFELTEAQRKSLDEILNDLNREFPMSRLLQGDVGSGKTIVAGLAILNTLKNGYQCALMAPTEILAEQHFKSIKRLFENQP